MSIQLPVQNKIELALVAYLSRFGGTVAPALLTDEAGLFDNLDFFNPNPVVTRRVLASWVGDQDPFSGVTWYPGHCAVDMAGIPRIVITCAQAGGPVSYAGYDDCMVEVVSMSEADDPIGQGTRHRALRDILTQGQLWAIQSVVNAPSAGPDTRAVQGFGLDALMFRDQIEGRDKETNQHGARLNLECTAHLA